jgi:hypothetical protein
LVAGDVLWQSLQRLHCLQDLPMLFRSSLPLAAAAAVALCGTPLMAQTEGAAETGDDIVVTGKIEEEPDWTEVRKQARSVTQATSIFNQPLARYNKKLCPGIIGMPLEYAELMVSRIRFNAELIGIETAEDMDCYPNFIVGFLSEPDELVQSMDSSSGSLLARIPLKERRRMIRDGGPVYAFSLTSLRTRDGRMAAQSIMDRYPTLNLQSANSLILLHNRIDIELSVVLMDIQAIDGLSIPQLADYATMRGLAKTRPIEDEQAVDSILGLFHSEGPHPWRLTPFDLAYLKSLYADSASLPAAAKLATVNNHLEKELEAAEKE